ncbi:polysaccharide biosynthesis tyrosine autokinase, partial [candidate division WOR-3 bacterium]|nr:polysaccharide biosynthesis tyrosine autokinase [candidate division WOR-3 bacterium]
GFFLAIIIAAGVIFLKEYIDDSIKNIDELERTLKVKVIGTIPSIVLKNGDLKDAASNKYKRYLLNELPSGSPIMESYKILRTNIIYLNEGKLKSLTVSSSTKGEGKSTTALNLAMTLSQLNRKVLLVDADLRKPILSKVLGIENAKEGLTDIIKTEVDFHKFIHKTHYSNLYLLSHGEVTLNSTELFESQKMKHIIKSFEDDFDFIIYDTPPILSVADPRIIARYTDGLVWVVQYKKAKKQELVHTKKLLSNLNTNIIGFVINNMSLTSPYGSYYYNYYYHYTAEDRT